MATKQETGPNKTDLFAILKRLERVESDRVLRLEATATSAEASLEKFCETDVDYRRLKLASEDANDAAWRQKEAERRGRFKDLLDARNLISLKGPTPKVVAVIEALIKKYSDGKLV